MSKGLTKFKSGYVLVACILIRLVIPIFLFQMIDPFFAILINEIILDGIFSPHHYPVINYIPDKYLHLTSHYYTDKPLDTWGFFTSLQPVLFKNNPFYSRFEGFRSLLTGFFCYRLLGYILFLVIKKLEVFLVFPNIYLSTYVIVSFFSRFYPSTSKEVIGKWIVGGIIFSILKEFAIYFTFAVKSNVNKDYVL